ECRKQRRKCIWIPDSPRCERCERLDRDCLAIDSDTETYPNFVEETVSLEEEVEQLSQVIDELAKEIERVKSESANTKSLAVTNKKPITSNFQATLGPWNVSIQNGRFCIETGIRNVADLLRLQSISYLSPLPSTTGGEENTDLVIQFSHETYFSIVPFALNLLAKSSGINKVASPSSTPTIPVLLLLDSNHSVIDRVLDVYFNCHNIFDPLIHKPTFMKYYNTLSDPLDSILVLSICCFVCSSPCSHLGASAHELRDMSDYFFDLAKEKLIDQFDDPEKRLENLVCIDFLAQYLKLVLRFSEGKRLLAMAVQFCVDLEPWFKASKEEEPISVERALYSRHFVGVIFQEHMICFFGGNGPLTTHEFPEWESIPDEPPETINFVTGQNYVLKLHNQEFISRLRDEVHAVHVGSVCTLKVEALDILNSIINEWWRDLPAKFRFCESWDSKEECEKAIDDCEDTVTLIIFNFFLVFILGLYSSLLKPLGNKNDPEDFLSAVQQYTLDKTYLFCHLLVYCSQKLSNIKTVPSCQYTSATNEHLLQATNALVRLTLSTNSIVNEKAREMLKLCMEQVDNMKWTKDNRVDPSHSPFRKSIAEGSFSSADLKFYAQFPQPWNAMMYDAFHHLTTS
ncbi:hypothetical protein K501DRAFT_176087, partial [Backusella circina FSU 941]